MASFSSFETRSCNDLKPLKCRLFTTYLCQGHSIQCSRHPVHQTEPHPRRHGTWTCVFDDEPAEDLRSMKNVGSLSALPYCVFRARNHIIVPTFKSCYDSCLTCRSGPNVLPLAKRGVDTTASTLRTSTGPTAYQQPYLRKNHPRFSNHPPP